jgi:hypothetical protein
MHIRSAQRMSSSFINIQEARIVRFHRGGAAGAGNFASSWEKRSSRLAAEQENLAVFSMTAQAVGMNDDRHIERIAPDTSLGREH